MAERLDTAEVRKLADEGAQLVEVLPASAFESEHLPGATNIPLPDLTATAVEQAGLDRSIPTIVYCYDHECDLSARGAVLLERLGFTEVYDYVGSKTAWLGEGLPAEGTKPASNRAGAIARPVPTAAPDERIGDLADRFDDDHELVVVVDEDDVILGIVRSEAAQLPVETPVQAVTQLAPPSVRPSITAEELARSMDDDGRTYVLVTTLHGELRGLIRRPDLYGQH